MEKAHFNNIRKQILKELKKAKKEIKIAVCWFTNQELFQLICEKVEAGVIVELIIINDYINNRSDGLDFQKFIKIGGKFYFGRPENPMHNKYCIIDNNVLLNGSYNWTYYAENKNEENLIVHTANEKLIKSYSKNFEKIKLGLRKIYKISTNAIYDIEDLNIYSSYNYLAQDYIYQAVETKNSSIVEKAIKLMPSNIQIQKIAIEYNLKTKRKTIVSIGEEIINNNVTILIPIGTEVPHSGKMNFTTTSDNQQSTSVKILHGEDLKASKNKLIGSFNISGIPPKKAGEARLLTIFKIDLQGILTVTEQIKETNNSITMKYDINHLLN